MIRPPAFLANRVLIGLVAGLVLGIGISASRNASLISATSLLEPVGTLWVNAIRMTVIPLVVSLLIVGLASNADVGAVGRVGGRSLLVFVGLLVASALFVLAVARPAFAWLRIDPGATAMLRARAATAAAQTAEGLRSLPTFAHWIAELVPTNPVRAAADGAMLPLIVFTLAFALAITRIAPDMRRLLVRFFQAIADAMLVLVRWIIALAPIGVFALILPAAARLGVTAAGAIGYYILVAAVTYLAFTLLLYVVALLVGGTPLTRFARAVFPAQVVAFSSSSSLASLPALIDGAERGLALPPAITGFVLPLSVSTFKVAAPMVWTVGTMFLARFYGIELSWPQLATVTATAVATSFSTPGVPHGAFLLMAPTLVSVGVPAEGVGMLIAVDAIPDIFATMLNVTGDLTAATIVARVTRAVSAAPPPRPLELAAAQRVEA